MHTRLEAEERATSSGGSMFKKSKSGNLMPPPSAPSLEEIISDLETFQIAPQVEPPLNIHEGLSRSHSLEDWWKLFEQFQEDLKHLTATYSDIEDYKQKLQLCKAELDAETEKIEQQVQEQQNLIAKALK